MNTALQSSLPRASAPRNIEAERILAHGQIFDQLWLSVRQWPETDGVCTRLAELCCFQASIGVSCVRFGCLDYPVAKFVGAVQDDAYAPLLGAVFAAYVHFGLIAPDAPLVLSDDAPGYYKRLIGMRPLLAAVRMGSLHSAELLLHHGANYLPDGPDGTDGTDGYEETSFEAFAEAHFGEMHFLRTLPEARKAFARRLASVACAHVSPSRIAGYRSPRYL